MSKKPNIVLVHGAWGDGSHWGKVILRLHKKGYKVTAVQNPLTSLPDDIDRTTKLAEAQEGPTLLVGHSYGGMVITGAGHAVNVVGLVYIAAFAPDEGENPGSLFGLRDVPPGAAAIRPDDNGFLWIDPERFHPDFCQDLDADEARVMALSQKPIAARCFDDKSGPPAWKVKPCWYQISSEDRMIPPATQEWFAERMKPKKTITLNAGHASMASEADAVVALIEEAAATVAGS
ncbi:alpha/beta hydrolase [Leisingera daeponensis]|uniref:Alpha/beta hydrolase n=1 Tax=Leisingera daeponensis TaxID=405746 RepID=A0ABS7NKU8_9RHOB|nr:alpha/beta hydrolase [Leisingera daeponensis]MBY6141838.1 alpha/beta hydrolase [Leisingera daeponensis]